MTERRCSDAVPDLNDHDCCLPDSDRQWFRPEYIRKVLDFTGMSYTTAARKANIPEGTMRKLLQGDTRDPRLSTIVPVIQATGADARVVLGVIPERDAGKEPSNDSTLLADALRKQVETLQDQVIEDDRRLVRLREMVLEKGEAKAVAEGRVAALEAAMKSCESTIMQQAETITQQECRLETKRAAIEDLRGQVSEYKARVEANATTIRNLESMRKRQTLACNILIAATCVLLLTTAALTSIFVWEIKNIKNGSFCTAWVQHVDPS